MEETDACIGGNSRNDCILLPFASIVHHQILDWWLLNIDCQSCIYHVSLWVTNKETVPFANCQILDAKSQVKLKPNWDADIWTNKVQAVCNPQFGSSHFSTFRGTHFQLALAWPQDFLAFSSKTVWLSKLTFRPGHIATETGLTQDSVGTRLRMWHLLKSSCNIHLFLS